MRRSRRCRKNDFRIRRRAEWAVGHRRTQQGAELLSYGVIAFVGYKIYKWWTGT